jgi:hypothetical protein
MQILHAEEFYPTEYDVQLLNSSKRHLNFDLLLQSVHPSEGDMLS